MRRDGGDTSRGTAPETCIPTSTVQRIAAETLARYLRSRAGRQHPDRQLARCRAPERLPSEVGALN